MNRRTILTWLLLLSLLVSAAAAQEQGPFFEGERIVVNAAINNQPIRLVYDTGAPITALSGAAAQRLKLKSTAARPGQIGGVSTTIERSEPLTLRIFGGETKTELVILPELQTGGPDGVLGWTNLLAPVVLIDGPERRVLSRQEPPTDGWLRFPLEVDSGQLFFVVTREGQPLGRVFIDTGLAHGLRLAPRLWNEWKQQHPDAPLTLEPFRYAFGPTLSHEMTWVSGYQLGDLTLYGCDLGPIAEAQGDEAVDASGKPYLAQLGLRGLRHLRIIISRPTKELLVQSVSPIPPHNRLGALFMPVNAETKRLVAQVAAGSPAAQAGILQGDVLLTVNGTGYEADNGAPPASLFRVFGQPAGTELELVVDRQGERKEFRVTLRDLLR